MPMSRIVKNLGVLFSKQSSPPSWRQASRYMFKNDFYLNESENSKFLILVLLTSRENQELAAIYQ